MKNTNNTILKKSKKIKNGKGDKKRPRQVSYDEYSKNWNLIFRKGKNK